ncbi:MAG: hypothetical protein HY744_03130 [Deltaproteobacteria bacterium]|nr:hypothetical protein [Deltaproteobacteria bacterium]
MSNAWGPGGRAALVAALLVAPSGCASHPFGPVSSPELPLRAAMAAPVPPEPVALAPEGASGEGEWRVADQFGKASLKRRSLGVFVYAERGAAGTQPGGAEDEIWTSRLIASLLSAGFRQLVDLSVAPEIQATVQRGAGGGSVSLSGALDRMLRVAAVLPVDYVLAVRLESEAQQATQSVRYAVPGPALELYRQAVAQHRARVDEYLRELGSKLEEYEDRFAAAKAEYERKGGSYEGILEPTAGQRAMREHDALLERVEALRGKAQDAREATVDPEQWKARAEARTRRETREQARVRCTATLTETARSAVVWVASATLAGASTAEAAPALLERLAGQLH